MNGLRKMIATGVGVALLATSAAPAVAGPRGWGNHGGWGKPYRGWSHGHRHHRGGDGFGNFLLGAVVAGGIIALASSASKQSKERKAREADGIAGGDGLGSRAERGLGLERDDDRVGTDRSRWTDAENSAANLCADAAEAMSGGRDRTGSRVDDIGYIAPDGTDGYRVEGRMDSGKGFACGTARGEVAWVQFSDAIAAR